MTASLLVPKGNYVIDLPQNWDRFGPSRVVVKDDEDLEKAMAANWRSKVKNRLKGHRVVRDIARALAGYWTLDTYQSWQGLGELADYAEATKAGVIGAIKKMVAAGVLTQVRLYRLNSAAKPSSIGTVWLPTNPDVLELVSPEMIAHELGFSPIRPGTTVDLLVEPAPLPHAKKHVRILRELTPAERAAVVAAGRPKPAGSGRKSNGGETVSPLTGETVSPGVVKWFHHCDETISPEMVKPFHLKQTEIEKTPETEFKEGLPGAVASLPAGCGILDSRPEEQIPAGFEGEAAAPPPALASGSVPLAVSGDNVVALLNVCTPELVVPSSTDDLLALLKPGPDLHAVIADTDLAGHTLAELEAFVDRYKAFGETYASQAVLAVLKELQRRKLTTSEAA